MAARPYKRLPGRHSGLFYIASLWEAEDHLLLVESVRVSEVYRRFFYRDIQAIVICRTAATAVRSWIFGVAGALFCLLALLSNSGQVWFAIFGVLFLLIAAIDAINGPSCKCTLQTAVKSHPLTTLRRLRVARKALVRIRARVEAAQSAPAAP